MGLDPRTPRFWPGWKPWVRQTFIWPSQPGAQMRTRNILCYLGQWELTERLWWPGWGLGRWFSRRRGNGLRKYEISQVTQLGSSRGLEAGEDSLHSGHEPSPVLSTVLSADLRVHSGDSRQAALWERMWRAGGDRRWIEVADRMRALRQGSSILLGAWLGRKGVAGWEKEGLWVWRKDFNCKGSSLRTRSDSTGDPDGVETESLGGHRGRGREGASPVGLGCVEWLDVASVLRWRRGTWLFLWAWREQGSPRVGRGFLFQWPLPELSSHFWAQRSPPVHRRLLDKVGIWSHKACSHRFTPNSEGHLQVTHIPSWSQEPASRLHSAVLLLGWRSGPPTAGQHCVFPCSTTRPQPIAPSARGRWAQPPFCSIPEVGKATTSSEDGPLCFSYILRSPAHQDISTLTRGSFQLCAHRTSCRGAGWGQDTARIDKASSVLTASCTDEPQFGQGHQITGVLLPGRGMVQALATPGLLIAMAVSCLSLWRLWAWEKHERQNLSLTLALSFLWSIFLLKRGWFGSCCESHLI